ncbi:MAG: preprotein translocase subunit YajC [Acidobacteria bacterium]|nr:preprotein translocase subunit YajC [Acidobacteriota bacterium]
MMNCFLVFFLQGAQGGIGSTLVLLMPMVFIVILYQFMIAKPQREQRRVHEEMLKNLKAGDKVITNSGIYGTVTELNEKDPEVVQLRIAEAVKINIARNAISALQEAKTAKESEKK